MLLYIAGRIPQIKRNFKRKSTKGLSVVMFLMAIGGNASYIAGIVLEGIRKEVLLEHMPWLAGSIVIMVLDIIIYIQSVVYRDGRKGRRARNVSNDTALRAAHAADPGTVDALPAAAEHTPLLHSQAHVHHGAIDSGRSPDPDPDPEPTTFRIASGRNAGCGGRAKVYNSSGRDRSTVVVPGPMSESGSGSRWVRFATHASYAKTGDVVEIISIEPPLPGDADVFLSIRLPDGTLRETCGRHLAPLPEALPANQGSPGKMSGAVEPGRMSSVEL